MINELDTSIPAPFLFNGLKHHRQTILELIKKSKEKGASIEEVSIVLKKVGNSMIDLYFGKLSPALIEAEIRNELIMHNFFYQEDYIDYINRSSKKYRNLFLSDGSEWTLLAGRDVKRYVHIHPSRGSKYTRRVNALACKTAILLMIFFEKEIIDSDLLPIVNLVRSDFLGASPVKSHAGTRRLQNVLDLLKITSF